MMCFCRNCLNKEVLDFALVKAMGQEGLESPRQLFAMESIRVEIVLGPWVIYL